MQKLETKSATPERSSKHQERLTSILRAASVTIAKDGFRGASVRAVAGRAKIGLSGIYYYFKSKDELLYALQHHTFSSLLESLSERMEKAVTPEDKLKAVIDNHFRFFVENMNELKVCVHELESLSGNYYRSVLDVRREYYRLVRDAVAENTGLGDDVPDLAALFLFGSLNWVYTWYDPKKNVDIERVSAEFARMFLDGIRATRG